MARILYSINGDGMGHVTRSSAIISELKKQKTDGKPKHQIKILIGSHRGYKVLKKRFSDVHEIYGMGFVYKDNILDIKETTKHNARFLLKGTIKNVNYMSKTIEKFKPDAIITDFEHFSMHISQLYHIPVICVDNVHSVSNFKYRVPKKYKKDYYAAKAIINTLAPNIDYNLITTFFYIPVKNKKTFAFPPILRKNILALKTSRKNHVLVYQTSSTNFKLVEMLKKINQRFIIYGFNINKKEKNLTFRKFNETQFFDDFRNCKACIANGGFSFVSESVSLHKPIMCVPIKGQFEQIINALHIKRLGYGEHHDKLSVDKIIKFIKNLDKYYENLKTFKKENNSKIIKKINEIIYYEIDKRDKGIIKFEKERWKTILITQKEKTKQIIAQIRQELKDEFMR